MTANLTKRPGETRYCAFILVHLLSQQVLMEILCYFLAILIGLSMGLVGSGGSILTVPLLVYFFGISPEIATSYSLFIVGSVSGLGAIFKFRKGEVNLQIAFLFGVTSIITVFLTRKYLFPAIPDNLWTIG